MEWELGNRPRITVGFTAEVNWWAHGCVSWLQAARTVLPIQSHLLNVYMTVSVTIIGILCVGAELFRLITCMCRQTAPLPGPFHSCNAGLILLMNPTGTEEQSFSLPTNKLVFVFMPIQPSSSSLAAGRERENKKKNPRMKQRGHTTAWLPGTAVQR